jgi:ADP-heptose:LPS heptosyltransferase
VAEWLKRERHAELLIITGEAESAEARALAHLGTPAHALPLRKLAAQLAQCRLFLGHDSGVSHLAAACGVPCVLLFGPTDPAMWAPPSPHVRVLKRGAEMNSISVEDVRALL